MATLPIGGQDGTIARRFVGTRGGRQRAGEDRVDRQRARAVGLRDDRRRRTARLLDHREPLHRSRRPRSTPPPTWRSSGWPPSRERRLTRHLAHGFNHWTRSLSVGRRARTATRPRLGPRRPQSRTRDLHAEGLRRGLAVSAAATGLGRETRERAPREASTGFGSRARSRTTRQAGFRRPRRSPTRSSPGHRPARPKPRSAFTPTCATGPVSVAFVSFVVGPGGRRVRRASNSARAAARISREVAVRPPPSASSGFPPPRPPNVASSALSAAAQSRRPVLRSGEHRHVGRRRREQRDAWKPGALQIAIAMLFSVFWSRPVDRLDHLADAVHLLGSRRQRRRLVAGEPLLQVPDAPCAGPCCRPADARSRGQVRPAPPTRGGCSRRPRRGRSGTTAARGRRRRTRARTPPRSRSADSTAMTPTAAGARNVGPAARRQVVALDVDHAQRAAAAQAPCAAAAPRPRPRSTNRMPHRAVLPDDAIGVGLRRGDRRGGQIRSPGRAWRRSAPRWKPTVRAWLSRSNAAERMCWPVCCCM